MFESSGELNKKNPWCSSNLGFRASMDLNEKSNIIDLNIEPVMDLLQL